MASIATSWIRQAYAQHLHPKVSQEQEMSATEETGALVTGSGVALDAAEDRYKAAAAALKAVTSAPEVLDRARELADAATNLAKCAQALARAFEADRARYGL